MQVTDISTAAQTPLFANQADQLAENPSTTLNSDFETFLKMLTVQMENQDPLNPIDSADYAVQLATFSSVEQQVLTNDLLSALSASLSGGGLSSLGHWVGMEVRGSSKAQFTENPIELAFPTFENADRKQLVISNEAGQTMARVELNLSATQAAWDGTTSNGQTALHGTYSFRVEGYKSGQLIAAEPAETYAKVTEARLHASGSELVLEGGITLKATDVSALRAAQ